MKKRAHIVYPALLALLAAAAVLSCHRDPWVAAGYGGYPREIAEIILTRCAITGCHDDGSNAAAAGLNLSTWEKLFEGSSAGSPVIPYSADQSFLTFFINSDTAVGPVVAPQMPFGREPLSAGQVQLIIDWISKGAPNDQGFVKFSDNHLRQKFYALSALCRNVAVFDAESRLVMRYVNAAPEQEPGFPLKVAVAPDGQRWYVLYNSGHLLSYRSADDQLLGSLYLGPGNWWSLAISGDSKKAMAADITSLGDFTGGDVVYIDLASLSVQHRYVAPADSFYNPIGLAANNNFTTALAACFSGNFIYKMDLTNPASPVTTKVRLDPAQAVSQLGYQFGPYAIAYNSDETKYFAACQVTNEVRVFSAENDSLLAVVPVGKQPAELALSESRNLLFVSCTEDVTTFPEGKGSVFVIDTKTHAVVTTIYTGYQPRGLAVDDGRGLVYVANRNADPVGADAPHHYTDCGGNNGYVTIIDLKTLALAEGYKTETAADPFSIAFRK